MCEDKYWLKSLLRCVSSMRNFSALGKIGFGWLMVTSALLSFGAESNYQYTELYVHVKWKTCESTRDAARDWAIRQVTNEGSDACYKLGDSWRFSKVLNLGYEQGLPCSNGKSWQYVFDSAQILCQKHIERKIKIDNIPNRGNAIDGGKRPVAATNSRVVGLNADPKKSTARNSIDENVMPAREDNGAKNVVSNRGGEVSARGAGGGLKDNPLDALVEKGRYENKINEAKAEYRKSVAAQCKSEMERARLCLERTPGCKVGGSIDVSACERKVCGSKPSEEICSERLSCNSSGTDNSRGLSLCIPVCNAPKIKNPAFAAWKVCADAASACHQDNSCSGKCNPNGFNVIDDCIAHGLKSMPNDESLMKKYAKESLTDMGKVTSYRSYLD